MNATSSVPLPAFLDELDQLIDVAADAKATVRPVRHSLIRALKDPGFGLACIERVLDGLDPGHFGWRYPKIHRDPAREYSVCVFHWPPGLSNAPHRHDMWTVTGVLHNRLRFTTFRVEPSRAGLIPEKRIDAWSGEVGYICTPCVHNVENPSEAPSLSIHIFSHPRAASAAVDFVEYPMEGTIPQLHGPVSAALDGATREYVLASCAEMVGAHSHLRSLPLLDRILGLAQARAQLVAVKGHVRARSAARCGPGALTGRAVGRQVRGPAAEGERRSCSTPDNPCRRDGLTPSEGSPGLRIPTTTPWEK
jgi:predicted metal-dependent enzyme (double-stranded beta helix superfamily)